MIKAQCVVGVGAVFWHCCCCNVVMDLLNELFYVRSVLLEEIVRDTMFFSRIKPDIFHTFDFIIRDSVEETHYFTLLLYTVVDIHCSSDCY